MEKNEKCDFGCHPWEDVPKHLRRPPLALGEQRGDEARGHFVAGLFIPQHNKRHKHHSVQAQHPHAGRHTDNQLMEWAIFARLRLTRNEKTDTRSDALADSLTTDDWLRGMRRPVRQRESRVAAPSPPLHLTQVARSLEQLAGFDPRARRLGWQRRKYLPPTAPTTMPCRGNHSATRESPPGVGEGAWTGEPLSGAWPGPWFHESADKLKLPTKRGMTFIYSRSFA